MRRWLSQQSESMRTLTLVQSPRIHAGKAEHCCVQLDSQLSGDRDRRLSGLPGQPV